MNFILDNTNIYTLQLNISLTIKEIKKLISDVLLQKGVINYNIKVIINGETEIAPVVFSTDEYDHYPLSSGHVNIKSVDIYIWLTTLPFVTGVGML